MTGVGIEAEKHRRVRAATTAASESDVASQNDAATSPDTPASTALRAMPQSANGDSRPSKPPATIGAATSATATATAACTTAPTATSDATHETVAFETGNPDTGVVSCGVLVVASRTPASSSHTVIVESIPGLMTTADFCTFVRPVERSIRHVRPLRLQTERNRYVVLLRFDTPEAANSFATVFAGRQFLRGLVQEACVVRDVISYRFERLAEDEGELTEGASADASLEGGQFPATDMFPAEGVASVPTADPLCPVCLERLNATPAALVTTFCNHTMHAACLSKWDLNRCPVCRHAHELTPEASVCMRCGDRDDLWMCVVCAFVGCGFYKSKHALEHFKSTQHPFAINLSDVTFWSGETLRAGAVWDYSSERFVNRLLSGDDGKVVEVEPNVATGGEATSSNAGGGSCCGTRAEVFGEDEEENDRGIQAAMYASRMDAVVDEYRARMEWMEGEHRGMKEQLDERIRVLEAEACEAAKERKALARRMGDAEKEANSLRDKNGFLKSLNETLLRDKQAWNEEVEKLKRQLVETTAGKQALEEQLKDVMMHLEAQAKIAGAGESCRSDASEMHGGDVVVGPSTRQRLAMKTHRR